MQENDFDKRIREMMENHGELPPANSWDSISSSLLRRRRSVVLRRSFGSIAAVAAVVTLFFLMGGGNLFTTQPELPKLNAYISPKEMLKEKKSGIIPTTKRFSSEKDIVIAEKIKILSAENVLEPKVEKQVEKQVENETTIEEKAIQGKEINNEIKVEKVDKREMKTLEMLEYEESVSAKRFKLKKPLLALSTMLSPSVSASSMELLSRSNTGHKDIYSSMDRSQISYENIYDTKYLPPVTIGFQILLPVNKRVSFGTGINYTLLYSYTNLQNRYGNQRQEQSVHYIGIPLSFYVNIIENKGFRLYANAGVTLEKGLALRYKVIGDIPQNYTRSVPGLQLSAGAGIGGEYMIHKNLGLYADPSVSYYFPGGQPVTVRTVQPLQFKFEVGLRFHL